jgi:hypothetical protein
MDKQEFDRIAREFGADVYGDIFSESGYGICFSFDICFALSRYCQDYWSGDSDPLYACYCALGRAPINFRAGMGGGFDPEEEYDPENDEYSTAREIYADMVANKNWKQYYKLVLWYCTESAKHGGNYDNR